MSKGEGWKVEGRGKAVYPQLCHHVHVAMSTVGVRMSETTPDKGKWQRGQGMVTRGKETTNSKQFPSQTKARG